MLQYVIVGLASGGIYALLAGGLVISYVSSGTLNFAFGAMAYFVARFFYFLNSQHGWGPNTSAALAILGVAPLLGLLLWLLLFRSLQHATQLTKIAATVGLAVAIPPAAALLFDDIAILRAPGLAPRPLRILYIADTPISMDQVLLFIAVVLVAGLGLAVLRYTAAGLTVRATVDSPALTAASGTNPMTVSLTVWVVASVIAGITGVLGAPLLGLAASNFDMAVTSAFAAVVAARMRSLPVALIVALTMGVAGKVLQYFLPSASSFTANVLNAVPFAFVLAFLLYFTLRRDDAADLQVGGGELDRGIRPALSSASTSLADRFRPLRPRSLLGASIGPSLAIAVVAILLVVMSAYWVSLLAAGIALAICFLAISIVTGEGGMIWLCQIMFVGLGASITAWLSTNHGWPVLPSIIAAGLVVTPVGLLIGALTIRLGALYTALVTLTFGLLVERIVFKFEVFYEKGSGVALARPSFISTDQAFGLFALGSFCVLAIVASQLRLASTGLALAASRAHPVGARTVGLSVTGVKLVVASLGAFVAAVGGGFLAMYSMRSIPDSYPAFTGLVWLAVVVTVGVRSNVAALVGGLAMSVFPGLVRTHLSTSWAQLPPLLFGLGAVMIAAHPDGSVATQGALIRSLGRKVISPLTARSRSGPIDAGSNDRVIAAES
jgi:branched-chain amino acid transport system permease protein